LISTVGDFCGYIGKQFLLTNKLVISYTFAGALNVLIFRLKPRMRVPAKHLQKKRSIGVNAFIFF
jgi:hypothetical protein